MTQLSCLIVDDDETSRYVVSRLMQIVGVDGTCLEARNGAEAIALVEDLPGEALPPGKGLDLIILDVNMPLMNGLEFLAVFSKIRKDHALLDRTKVVLCSSTEDAVDIATALSYPFVSTALPKDRLTPTAIRNALEDCGFAQSA